jgi:hypothetical protein
MLGLFVAASLAFAASASAASLFVSVKPKSMIVGRTFTFTLTGTGVTGDEFDRVIAFTQPGSPACRPTPGQEAIRFRVRVSQAVTESPFVVRKSLKSSALGKRRVCAYLYSGDANATVLTATATYRVLLPFCTHRGQRRCRRR